MALTVHVIISSLRFPPPPPSPLGATEGAARLITKYYKTITHLCSGKNTPLSTKHFYVEPNL